jgi:hypothetical protein
LLLYQLLVDDTSAGGILRSTLAVEHEETLADALVHNNDSNLRLRRCLVVQVTNSLLELGNLDAQYLVALSISNTVTVNDKVCGELSFVVNRKGLYGSLDRINHLLLDDLLTLGLNKVITEVLAQVGVDTCREADDRLGTSMAYINTDQHGTHGFHLFREAQSVKISAEFAVDLAQDVGGLAQVKLEGVASCNHLGWQTEVVHHLFHHRVVVLLPKKTNHYLRVSESFAAHHEVP